MSLKNDVSLADLVRATERLAEEGDRTTHLGICPMSEELTRAPIELALEYDFPVLFVASRNQVSEDELQEKSAELRAVTVVCGHYEICGCI